MINGGGWDIDNGGEASWIKVAIFFADALISVTITLIVYLFPMVIIVVGVWTSFSWVWRWF